jgi:hypothetical protein
VLIVVLLLFIFINLIGMFNVLNNYKNMQINIGCFNFSSKLALKGQLWTHHESQINCLNLTSLFALFVFLFCSLTSGAFTIDSSTPTLNIQL